MHERELRLGVNVAGSCRASMKQLSRTNCGANAVHIRRGVSDKDAAFELRGMIQESKLLGHGGGVYLLELVNGVVGVAPVLLADALQRAGRLA